MLNMRALNETAVVFLKLYLGNYLFTTKVLTKRN
jgi:hypothetical protein